MAKKCFVCHKNTIDCGMGVIYDKHLMHWLCIGEYKTRMVEYLFGRFDWTQKVSSFFHCDVDRAGEIIFNETVKDIVNHSELMYGVKK